MKINSSILLVLIVLIVACAGEGKQEKQKKPVQSQKAEIKQSIIAPDFDADSAYVYVKNQVDFGPRYPNNEAHGKCADYLKRQLSSFGFNSSIQIGKATTFNSTEITIKNIIGEYNSESNNRILLFAHWDSRPFADQDTKDMTKPILGANDGGSGVGVLLEVARQISIKKPNIGIDIIFFDAEDYGQPSSDMMTSMDTDSWCLGSQYWAKNPHKPNYKANFGILLDMVGSSNATFTHESISMQYAPDVVRKVWGKAQQLGYGNYFKNQQTFFVGTDDHKYVNQIANIPSIDIIHYESTTGNFHSSWHTHQDDMSVIDKNSLQAVGQTLLAVIFDEAQ